MARYIVTNGTYFNPMDYDTLMKPVQAMQERHDAAADAYDTLNLETEAIRQYITENPGDKRALAIYNNYHDKLSKLQNGLWENGVTSQTRRDLSSARAGFAEVGKIKNAIQNRQKRSQEYWDARHKDPTLVAGKDPALGGLDNYLDNELYGQDWYSYSGKDFMTEVGTDAKARANEMLRNPEVSRDPRLVGYLTRITKEGFTSSEVDRAYDAVRGYYAGNADAFKNLSDPEKILADVLTSHVDSTGARGVVDDNEFSRLLDYGRAGLSHAIGETKIDELNDKVWDTNNKLYLARKEQEMKLKADAAKAALAAGGGHIEDSITQIVSGPGYTEASKRLKSELGPDRLVISKDGKELHNAADASDLVYGGDIRRRAYAQLGFDIGRSTGGAITSSNNFLHGETSEGGVAYETRYNPHTHTVEARVKGSNDKFRTSRALTNIYNQARQDYQSRVDYYKNNDSKVYEMATIDPDKQHKMYEREELDFGIPLTSYADNVMSKTENQKTSSWSRTWVARTGTDSGKYVDRAAGLLGSSIAVTYDGSKASADKYKNWRAHTGQSSYIHAITPYGTLDKNPVKNLNDVFKFNKNTGEITNLSSIQVDLNGILNDYIICGIAGNDTMYGVGLDMFGSDMITGAFSQARNMIVNVMNNPNYSDAEKEQKLKAITDKTSVQLKNILGYYTNTQSEGGTNKENAN